MFLFYCLGCFLFFCFLLCATIIFNIRSQTLCKVAAVAHILLQIRSDQIRGRAVVQTPAPMIDGTTGSMHIAHTLSNIMCAENGCRSLKKYRARYIHLKEFKNLTSLLLILFPNLSFFFVSADTSSAGKHRASQLVPSWDWLVFSSFGVGE